MVDLPTTSTVAEPHSFGASLDTLLVRLAPAPSRPIVTELAPAQAQRFSTEANPEDVMPEFGDVHSITSWVGGEGLHDRWRHGGTDADASRFWSSEHIDVSPTDEGIPEELRLLTQTAIIDPSTSTLVRLAASGIALWATSGTTLRTTVDVLAASPVFTVDDPHAGEAAVDVEDVVTLGTTPYAALGANGVHRDTGAGWAHWSDVLAVRIWSALDRIVASTGDALYEAAAGASSVLLYTLPAGDTWTDVSDAGGAIVASATNGYVYSFAPDDAGDLTIAGQAQLEGEQPVAVRARGDVVFVATKDGTSARLWMASGPELNGLQLLREWPDAQVDRMSMGRDRLLIGLLEDGEGWVWRLELATIGLSKAHRLADGPVHGLLAVGGVVVAGVGGVGVLHEVAALQPEGWLIGPMADFFRAEDKSWMTAWIDAAIDLGQAVSLYYTTDRAAMRDPDHASWRRVRTYKATTSGVERTLGARVEARSLALMVRLEAAADNTSPKVRAIAVRAYPGSGDVVVRLPVDVGDQVERHGRKRLIAQGWGEAMMDALREYEGKGVRVHLFRTGETVRGVVENIATPQPAATRRGSSTVVSMVTVRGRRVDEATLLDIGDGGAWGNAVWGGMSWGGETLDEE